MWSNVAVEQEWLSVQNTKQEFPSRRTYLKLFLLWFMSNTVRQHSSFSRDKLENTQRIRGLQKAFPSKGIARILLEIKESWKSSNTHESGLFLFWFFCLLIALKLTNSSLKTNFHQKKIIKLIPTMVLCTCSEIQFWKSQYLQHFLQDL